jgi:hypothetical protein
MQGTILGAHRVRVIENYRVGEGGSIGLRVLRDGPPEPFGDCTLDDVQQLYVHSDCGNELLAGEQFVAVKTRDTDGNVLLCLYPPETTLMVREEVTDG